MSHYLDLASKRGLAYRCMKCLPPSSYIGEKGRVEAHIWKNHIPLNEIPFFCSLCLFRATREGEIRRHVMTFPSHLLQKNKLMASNKFVGDEYYLKKSSNPYHLTPLDLVPMTHQESHDFWSTKRRRVEQPKGLQSGSVSLFPVHLAPLPVAPVHSAPLPVAPVYLAPLPVAPAQTLDPLLSSSTLSNYSWVNSSTASHTATSAAPIATSSSMIPQMTISPESFSQYLPVDLIDFSTDPYSPELSSPARVIVERDAQEDVEYVLPQILEEELPPSLNLPLYTPPVVLSTQKSACNSCKRDSTIKELLCVVKTLTTAQEKTFKQLQHFDKTISSISTEIACFRGQLRQYFERQRPRFQTKKKLQLSTTTKDEIHSTEEESRTYRRRTVTLEL